MEEKIKIYVPESIEAILLKDMERFEFFKKDRTLNRNEFLNTLIVNYFENYQKENNEIFDHIKETLKRNTKCNEFQLNDLSYNILSFVEGRTNKLEGNKSEVTLSLKPTKNSSTVISYIQNYLVKYTTLSNYFRNMLASYTLLPQDRRERIIFKNNYDLIREAIREKRKIYFTTANRDAIHVVSPYAIANSKEELFNYLLAEYNGFPFSFRISRLKKIVLLNEQLSVKKTNVDIFNKMIKYGPQFAYQIKEEQTEIRVHFSERGKEMFQSIYLHRPAVTRIDGDDYCFNCSRAQAFQYFSRFGQHAIIKEPQNLTKDLLKYYTMAHRAYGKEVNRISSEQENRDPQSEES